MPLVSLAIHKLLAILCVMDIKTARKAKGWTQSELADHMNVSRGAVAQWEMVKGTRPDPARAMLLTTLLPGLKFEHIYPQSRAAA
ncbi:XRE family transcriptional regulator [Rhodanobacter glycinis]|nr:XRE family transcriptional regulator [Rhodanobacter glycinis]